MPLKIFRNIPHVHDFCPMFFDINGDDYEYYYPDNGLTIDQVDIVISSPTPILQFPAPSSTITVDLEIWDNYENQYWAMVNYISTDFRISNAVDTTMQDARIVYCDFLFNRTKAYYSGFNFRPTTKKWYWMHPRAYELPRHPAVEMKNKIYVAPNKTWEDRHRKTQQRGHIVNLLYERYLDLGYLGDYHRHQDLWLYPHWEAPDCTDIDALIDHSIPTSTSISRVKSANLWGYSPPHNLYYEDSFISIYGETIEAGTSIAVTEKTYDPLIKGHFILPFSCQGFIGHLRQIGFELPKFINYEYDIETNDQKRFSLYTDEVKRLLDLSIDYWREQWLANANLMKHNQEIFFQRDYDRVNFGDLL